METFVIKGYAGCGKTETLISIANELKNKRGIYLNFNRTSIFDVKDRFPKGLRYTSFHAFAQNSIPSHLKNRKNNAMTMQELSKKYKLNYFDIPYSEDYKLNAKHKSEAKYQQIKSKPTRRLTAVNQMQMINEAIRFFCKSSDDQVDPCHFHRQLWMDEEHYNNLALYLTPVAQQYWEDMIEPNSPLNVSFDAQLKYWSLSNPVLDFDYILIDDYNEGYELLDKFIVSQNAPCFVAYDEFQMLNQWHGQATDIGNSDLPFVMLSESFRTGRNLNSHINLLLSAMGANTPIHSNLGIKNKCIYKDEETKSPDGIMCKTNIGAFCELVNNQKLNPNTSYAVYCNKHQVRMWLDSANRLMNNKRSYHPDFCVFANWFDVVRSVELTRLTSEFRVFVELVKEYEDNFSVLYEILDRDCGYIEDPDCIITTIELSKNFLFENVSLSNDFELFTMPDKIHGLNHQRYKKVEDLYLENWDVIPFTQDLAFVPCGNQIHGILMVDDTVPEMSEQLDRITFMPLDSLKSLYIFLTRTRTDIYLKKSSEIFILLDKLRKNLD